MAAEVQADRSLPCRLHGLRWCGTCSKTGDYRPSPDFARLYAASDLAGSRNVITAKWPGKCRGCGGRWDEGDRIEWSAGEDAWICADCASRE